MGVIMPRFTKPTLVVAVVLMMTACASNKGSFELNDATLPKIEQQNKPKLQDVPTEPRTPEQIDKAFEPALGFELKIPERNVHPDGNEDVKNIKDDEIKPINDSLTGVYDRLTTTLIRDSRYTGGNDDVYIEGSKPKYPGWHRSREREYMKFVNSGWIVDTNTRLKPDYPNNSILRGVNGYVFYQGINPATALPTQTVHYKGTWDFTTNAKKSRPAKDLFQEFKAGAGDNYGAFSYNESGYDDSYLRENGLKEPVSHTSEFEVNFADKSLTGHLYRNKGDRSAKKIEKIDRYTINAKLHGNRFRGSATSANKDDPYFGANSSTLEGGFFGDKAQELAGKFLADDNSLFAVFGARQHKDGAYVTDDTTADTITVFDAVRFDGSTFEKKTLDTFGDATKLVVNGRSFSLLPAKDVTDFITHHKYELDKDKGDTLVINACCSNLSYLKFGNYYVENNGNKGAPYLFLTGERTSLADMPTKGQVQYAGTWEANILTKGQKVGGVSPNKDNVAGSRAQFGVDFDDKTISGVFYQDNGTSAAITMNGVINGNGFNGRFKSRESGLILDSVTGDSAHVSGEIAGGFYGPKASEIGGYFSGDGNSPDKINGVFGGKKQVLTD